MITSVELYTFMRVFGDLVIMSKLLIIPLSMSLTCPNSMLIHGKKWKVSDAFPSILTLICPWLLCAGGLDGCIRPAGDIGRDQSVFLWKVQQKVQCAQGIETFPIYSIWSMLFLWLYGSKQRWLRSIPVLLFSFVHLVCQVLLSLFFMAPSSRISPISAALDVWGWRGLVIFADRWQQIQPSLFFLFLVFVFFFLGEVGGGGVWGCYLSLFVCMVHLSDPWGEDVLFWFWPRLFRCPIQCRCTSVSSSSWLCYVFVIVTLQQLKLK